MKWVVVIVAVVAIVGLIGWFLATRHQPELVREADEAGGTPAEAAHGTGSPTTQGRPAGADAENMSADQPGGRTRPGHPDPPQG